MADGLVVHNSHSAAYALITYQTAYLKAHYPVELLCGIMTSDKEKIDKVVRTIADARAMGVTVLPPDVNESRHRFQGRLHAPATGTSACSAPSGPRSRRTRAGRRSASVSARCAGSARAALEALLEARARGRAVRRSVRLRVARRRQAHQQGRLRGARASAARSTPRSRRAGISRAQAFASIEIALERSRAASRDRERGQTNMFGLLDAGPSRPAARRARRPRRAATSRASRRGTDARCSCASARRSASTSPGTRSSAT